MPITRITGPNIANNAISTNKVDAAFTATYATYAAVAANLTPRITTVNVANSSYTVLDDVAVNTSGGYLVITGANFQSGAIVTIENSQATSTTYVNDTTLRAQVAARNAGSYTVYVQNPDGGTAIRVNGVTFSNTPVWSTAATLSNQAANTAFAVNISANSDSNVTYSNTTSLPAGTTLLANGLFYGTVTVGAETVYSFDVRATDAELQDTPRTFSLTVTVGPDVYILYSTGNGAFGKGGQNTVNEKSAPTQIGTSSDKWQVLSTSYNHVLAIKENGTLWCWGRNVGGQLGLNNIFNVSSPVQIGSSTTWTSVSTSEEHSLAISGGALFAMGSQDSGRLGLNNTTSPTYRSSPTQVGTDTNWSKITSGLSHSAAIKTNGTLWVWGSNAFGKLGLDDTVLRSSPTQVGSATNWSEVYSYGSTNLALKTDNTLWVWGNNSNGELGLNQANTVRRSSPTQIGTETNWSKVIAGYDVNLAVKSNGTLWSWGTNTNGQLGLNNVATVSTASSPTQIGSNTTWLKVGVGYSHCAAIKTDNTLWVWGRNHWYQLGLNNGADNATRSSPVQVGTDTNWKYAVGGIETFFFGK